MTQRVCVCVCFCHDSSSDKNNSRSYSRLISTRLRSRLLADKNILLNIFCCVNRLKSERSVTTKLSLSDELLLDSSELSTRGDTVN